jgi:hypothetical protein
MRLAGVEPGRIQSAIGRAFNAGPNGRVFEVQARLPEGQESMVLQVCQNVAGSGEEHVLRRQFRNLLFCKFNIPCDVADATEILRPSMRRAFTPRPGCPPEIIEPYLEAYGTFGGNRIYMFTSEIGEGVELNRFEGNFVSNPPGLVDADDAESLAIGREIIRVRSQLYACTFDPNSAVNPIPTDFQMNNGDVIIKPGNLRQPRIRIVAINNIHFGGPEAFIDEVLSPKAIDLQHDRTCGWIIPVNVENLPIIVEAVEDGVRQIFPGRERDMVREWFKTFAQNQEREYARNVACFSRVAGAIQQRDTARIENESSELNRTGHSTWMRYNLGFTHLFVNKASDRIRHMAPPEAIDRLAEETHPLICRQDILQAIREM